PNSSRAPIRTPIRPNPLAPYRVWRIPMHGLKTSPSASAAPRAHRRPLTSVRHGVTLIDDYAWLRADNWQDVMRDPAVLDAEIRAHLEAENAYSEAALADTRHLQES